MPTAPTLKPTEVGPGGFSGWGRQAMDDKGAFSFKTIKPGRVQGPDGRPMAPHVSLWIVARGINIGLQTRLYFDDEADANATDWVLNRILDPARRKTLIASKQTGTTPRYVLDIRLQGENETVFFDSMTPLLSALAGDPEVDALLSDDAQLTAMLSVERALAQASADAGLIDQAAAAAIASAIAAFSPDHAALAAGMARDGVVVPELVAQLRDTIPQARRAALHKGATSQDIVDTALMVQTAKILDILQARLAEVLTRLAALHAANGERPLLAHTRMQAALPTNWGDKLQSWSDPLQRHLAALDTMRRGLLVIQLGGPVGDRRSFDGKGEAVAAALAKHLDLGLARPWHSARDPIVALGDRLALLTGSLGKIGADVALLAQTEIGAITLKDGGGSSAMAHKSNPVTAEVLVALARFNAGLAGTLQQAMVHEYERSGAAWTLEWLTLPQIFVTTGASLRLSLKLCDQIQLA